MQTADGRLPAPWADQGGDPPGAPPATALTGRRRPTAGQSRRTFVLGVMAVGALAGCGLVREPDAEPAPSELEPVLVGALDLLAAHQAAIAAHSSLGDLLTPLVRDHQAHADRIAKQLGRPSPAASGVPEPPPVPDTPAGAKRLLAAMELAAQRTASAATLTAAARHAELTAAVAACRASHVAVLR